MVGEEMPDEPSKGKDVKREDDTMMDIDDNKATGSKRTLEHESPEPRSNGKKKKKVDSLKGLLADAESIQESMPSSKTIKIVTSSINLDRREKNVSDGRVTRDQPSLTAMVGDLGSWRSNGGECHASNAFIG